MLHLMWQKDLWQKNVPKNKHLEKVGKLERNDLLQVRIKKGSSYNCHTIGFYLIEQQFFCEI